MGRVRRRDRVCHDPPCHLSSVNDVAGIFARGIMRLRDRIRDSSCVPTRPLRLKPDAGEADCHAPASPAPQASTGREPTAGGALPPP